MLERYLTQLSLDSMPAAILSSMQLAHLVPGTGPSDPGGVGTALQVYSIKISEIKGGLQWPLRVYGVVAVRDTVDHNRNVLFARDSTAYQIVEEDVRISLCLIFFWVYILLHTCLPWSSLV